MAVICPGALEVDVLGDRGMPSPGGVSVVLWLNGPADGRGSQHACCAMPRRSPPGAVLYRDIMLVGSTSIVWP